VNLEILEELGYRLMNIFLFNFLWGNDAFRKEKENKKNFFRKTKY